MKNIKYLSDLQKMENKEVALQHLINAVYDSVSDFDLTEKQLEKIVSKVNQEITEINNML